MSKRMLIDALHPEEMRVVLLNGKQIEDFDFVTAAKKQVKGNIYLAKITRVEPSLQAAFVEYGSGKQGFLPFSEIHPDYYQIPISDRQKLIEEAEAAAAEAEAEEDAKDAAEAGNKPESAHSEDGDADAADDESPSELPPAFEIPKSPDLEESTDIVEETVAALPRSITEEAVSFSTSTEVSEEQASAETAADASAEGTAEGDKLEEVKTSEEFETLSGSQEEEEEAPRTKRVPYFRRYKIQEVIKRGQIVLVQVTKEERGNKGVSLTTFLSLPGRYCVLMPNSPKDGGISRKIANSEDRKRLKQICAELKLARGMSVIIRTAGLDRTRAEIKRDFDYLVKLWNQIRDNTLASTAPALIYEESDLVKRSIRDLYSNDIEEVSVQGDEAYHSAREFMKMILPSHASRIKHYTDSTPLFFANGVEDSLLSMLDPVVKLRSGGYIVINPTEALVSIDVNSGRATGERNIEETATKTNIEAAQEISRQLRLRDLAGLVVIDFIDMFESRNRRAVEKALKEALRTDRAKIQLGRISPFGLLEMSRQRLRPSISESTTMPCPHCGGRGHVRSDESLSIQIIRMLEKEASTGNWHTLRVSVPENIALHMLNTKRAALDKIESTYSVSLQILVNRQLGNANYHIEKMRRSPAERVEEQDNNASEKPTRRRSRRRRNAKDDQGNDEPETTEAPEEAGSESEDEENARPARERGGRRRGRRGGARNRRRRDSDGDDAPESADADANPNEAYDEPASEDDADGEKKRSRRGGRRGGRKRWQDKGEGQSEDGTHAESADTPSEKPHKSEPKAAEPVADAKVEEISSWRSIPTAEDEKPKTASASQGPKQSDTPAPSTPRKGWWQKMIELDD